MTARNGPLAAISGASVGIGNAIARKLAGHGFRTALIGRSAERLQALAATLPQASAYVTDMADRRQVEQLFERMPPPDIWINNAGVARGQPDIDEVSGDDVDCVIDTNLKGALHASRLAAAGMRKRGTGHIVTITSAAAFNAYRGGNLYAVSKAALHMLNQCLRQDLGGTPIRVTEIAPGIVGDTEFSARRFDGDLTRYRHTYEGVEMLTADDIADAVHFCVTAPPRVNVELMLIYPVQQHGGSGKVHRRNSTVTRPP